MRLIRLIARGNNCLEEEEEEVVVVEEESWEICLVILKGKGRGNLEQGRRRKRA